MYLKPALPCKYMCIVYTRAMSIGEIPPFTNVQIVSYFVTRTISNDRASSDFKSLNQSALNLFRCEHEKSVEVSSDEAKLRANCLPE